MKISELIAKLKKLPQDLTVVVRGYEGGYDDVNDVKIIELTLNPDARNFHKTSKHPLEDDYYWFYGVYEKAKKHNEPKGAVFEAAFIEQYDNDDKHRNKRDSML